MFGPAVVFTVAGLADAVVHDGTSVAVSVTVSVTATVLFAALAAENVNVAVCVPTLKLAALNRNPALPTAAGETLDEIEESVAQVWLDVALTLASVPVPVLLSEYERVVVLPTVFSIVNASLEGVTVHSYE